MRSQMSTLQAQSQQQIQASGVVNYDSLRDQLRDNNALKQKVEMLREQATINM